MPIQNKPVDDDSPDETIEDNQNQEENEEETSEEQSEEMEKSESAEDNSNSEDSSEEEAKSYIDIASLPPEMKEIGKRMLASHTKERQKLKQEYAALEENLTNTYSQDILKAKALDELGKNIHFQAFIADVIENGRPYGYSSQFRGADRNEDKEEDSGDLDKQSIQKLIDAAVEARVEAKLKPLREKETLDTFNTVSKLPFFQKNKPQITELVQKYGMNLKEAYTYATAEDRAAAAIEEKRNKAKDDVKVLKKLPRTEKSSSGGESPALSKKTVKTLREAIGLAFQE